MTLYKKYFWKNWKFHSSPNTMSWPCKWIMNKLHTKLYWVRSSELIFSVSGTKMLSILVKQSNHKPMFKSNVALLLSKEFSNMKILFIEILSQSKSLVWILLKYNFFGLVFECPNFYLLMSALPNYSYQCWNWDSSWKPTR